MNGEKESLDVYIEDVGDVLLSGRAERQAGSRAGVGEDDIEAAGGLGGDTAGDAAVDSRSEVGSVAATCRRGASQWRGA